MVVYRYSFDNLCFVGKVADSDTSVSESVSDPSSDLNSSVLQVSDQLELTNHLLSSMVFILGIIAGLLCLFIFWSRFRKY